MKKKSLRHAILRGEVKIDLKDISSFEQRANSLQYQAGQAMVQLNTVRELFAEQKNQNDNDFFNRKNYRDDIKHSLIVGF